MGLGSIYGLVRVSEVSTWLKRRIQREEKDRSLRSQRESPVWESMGTVYPKP